MTSLADGNDGNEGNSDTPSTPDPTTYPKTVTAGDGEVRLRLLAEEDKAALGRFIAELSPHDLLFLRRDITDPEVVDGWVTDAGRRLLSTILAFSTDPGNEQILGYATVDPSRLSWSSHVAELRVLVGAQARGRGLGKILTQEAFRQAMADGIEKMVARMTLDQQGAIAVFESLGFRPEALLKNHVKDRQGNRHDLLMMSHDVAHFQSTLDSYGVPEALQATAG